MHDVRDSIEKGLRLYQDLVEEDEALEGEFRGSLSEFFSSGIADRVDRAMATRRHIEWFLLERPSEKLGGVPVEALQAEWLARAEPAEADIGFEPFLQSIAGVFEITSTEPDNGLWLRDLFGHGEYPVDERDAARRLEMGDLLIGRLFPIGGGLFTLSPAVSCFRNRSLVGAVRADLERMRGARRGVLRIQQSDLERLFFSAAPIGQQAHDVPTIDLNVERVNARAALRQAGLDSATTEDLLELVAQAARDGRGFLTDVLSELAFETDVDLDSARRVLSELWALECHGGAHDPEHPAPSTNGAVSDAHDDDSVPVEKVHDAIEAFDAGRESGADLTELCDQLADDLGVEVPSESFGLDGGEEDEASGVAVPPAKFPGVIGAMIDEFLWDVRREQGGHVAERMEGLRRLSEYGHRIGAFENFGRREVLDFAGRWLLDEGGVRGPEEARAVLAALAAFCRWSEEHQSHPLWTDCGELLDRLNDSVPRLVVARQHAAPRSDDDKPWDVIDVQLDTVVLRNKNGDERRVRTSPQMEKLLRAGDLVHARTEESTIRISVSYPAELRELLDGRSD